MGTVTDLRLEREPDSVARLVHLYYVALVYIEEGGKPCGKDEPRGSVLLSVVPSRADLVEPDLVVARVGPLGPHRARVAGVLYVYRLAVAELHLVHDILGDVQAKLVEEPGGGPQADLPASLDLELLHAYLVDQTHGTRYETGGFGLSGRLGTGGRSRRLPWPLPPAQSINE